MNIQDAPPSKRLEDVVDPAKHRLSLSPGYATDTPRTVTVGGMEIPAFWCDHVDAQENDPLWVLLVERPDAPATALVIAVNGTPAALAEYPLDGTVSGAPLGSNTVTVTTESGPIEAAFGVEYVPKVSDKVRLLWQDGNAWVLGKSAKVPAPKPKKPVREKPSVPRPPGGSGAGQTTFTASDSATYSSGTRSWNGYFGKDVYQGSYPGTGSNRGAWFYHNKPAKLRGKRITKVEIWVPRRSNAGNWKASVRVQFMLHGSSKRPGGDVTRFSSNTVTVPAKFKGGWYAMPTKWGDHLVGGSGISIAGGAYAGFYGVKQGSKNSGQIRLTWEG